MEKQFNDSDFENFSLRNFGRGAFSLMTAPARLVGDAVQGDLRSFKLADSHTPIGAQLKDAALGAAIGLGTIATAGALGPALAAGGGMSAIGGSGLLAKGASMAAPKVMDYLKRDDGAPSPLVNNLNLEQLGISLPDSYKDLTNLGTAPLASIIDDFNLRPPISGLDPRLVRPMISPTIPSFIDSVSVSPVSPYPVIGSRVPVETPKDNKALYIGIGAAVFLVILAIVLIKS
jgi:hypothetical protein